MKFIIGLGNPTAQYVGTRHNIGFDAITRLADDHRISVTEKKHKALCGKGIIGGEKVILLKPQTYMNLSGESVRAVLDFYKAGPEDIIVCYDDVSLAPGQLRVRKKGSAGGHNGIKNIIGAFYPPQKVVIDPNVLVTLDNRQLLSGLVEAIKMGATSDKQLFDLIKNSIDLEKDIKIKF